MPMYGEVQFYYVSHLQRQTRRPIVDRVNILLSDTKLVIENLSRFWVSRIYRFIWFALAIDIFSELKYHLAIYKNFYFLCLLPHQINYCLVLFLPKHKPVVNFLEVSNVSLKL